MMESAQVKIHLVPHGYEVDLDRQDEGDNEMEQFFVCRDFADDIDPHLLGEYLFFKIKATLTLGCDELLERLRKFKKEV